MDSLIDLFIEIAKNWRVLVSAIACFSAGLVLSHLLPDLIVYLALGGFGVGIALGLYWQSRQSTFNF